MRRAGSRPVAASDLSVTVEVMPICPEQDWWLPSRIVGSVGIGQKEERGKRGRATNLVVHTTDSKRSGARNRMHRLELSTV